MTGCAVAHGFVELCGQNEKVLCCAYSNVGADNVVRGLKDRGLKVIRVGRVTAISDYLLQDSLEYHLSKDKRCNEALKEAQRATQTAKKSKDRNTKAEATGKGQRQAEKSLVCTSD